MIKIKEIIKRNLSLSTQKKTNLELLIDEINLTYLDFSRFLKNNEISSRYDIHCESFVLGNYRKNKKNINFILSRFPHTKTSMLGANAIRIYVNTEQLKNILYTPKINRPLTYLESISGYYNKEKIHDVFQFLLDKYDSTFILLIGTLREMREETGEKDEENEKLMSDILDNFINEFMSLVDIYTERSVIDKKAFHNSLKERLTNELELTNRIKTNWNSNELLG